MKHLVLGLGRYSAAALQQLNQLRVQHEQTADALSLLWLDSSAFTQSASPDDVLVLDSDQMLRLNVFDADSVYRFVTTQAQAKSSPPAHELAAHQLAHTRRWARTLFLMNLPVVLARINQIIQDAVAKHVGQAHPFKLHVLAHLGHSPDSALLVDMLGQLRLHYPDAPLTVYAYLPDAQQPGVLATDLAGAYAGLLELQGLARRVWQPDALVGKDNDAAPTRWFDACYLQTAVANPADKPTADIFARFIWEHLNTVPENHTTAGQIEADLHHEALQIGKNAHKQQFHLLPRYATLFQAALNIDQHQYTKCYAYECARQLSLGLLYANWQPGHGFDEQIAAGSALHETDLLDSGWLLSEEHLLLNRSIDPMQPSPPEPIAEEWLQRAVYFTKNLNHAPNEAWDSQFDQLRSLYQKVYDKNFRGHGVDLFYSLSESRLEALAQQYLTRLEQGLIHWWQTSACPLDLLPQTIQTIIRYHERQATASQASQSDQSRQVRFVLEELDRIKTEWQKANKKEKAAFANKYPWPFINDLLAKAYTAQTMVKATVFAEQLVYTTNQQLHALLHQIEAALKPIQQRAQYYQQQLQQLMTEKGPHGYQYSIQAAMANFALQPDDVSLKSVTLAAHEPLEQQRTAIIKQLTAGWDKGADWTQVQEALTGATLQQALQSASSQLVEQLLGQPASRVALLYRRLDALSDTDSQVLGKQLQQTVSRQYQHSLAAQPLGHLLTAQHRQAHYRALIVSSQAPIPASIRSRLQGIGTALTTTPPKTSVFAKNVGGISYWVSETFYLSEWPQLAKLKTAYQNYLAAAPDTPARLALHIEGDEALFGQKKFLLDGLNLEFIREQLLRGEVLGAIQASAPTGAPQQLVLISLDPSSGTMQEQRLSASDFIQAVDALPIGDLQRLVHTNNHLQQSISAETFANRAQPILEQRLLQIKDLCMPPGLPLEQANWQQAGKYVVWSRAAANVLKQKNT